MKNPIHIGISGGAGQICYSLLIRIAAGEMLGADQPVILHILETPQAVDALKGVEMELKDCAFSALHGIEVGCDPMKVFEKVEIAILVGARPRSRGMERADLLQGNAAIFRDQAAALDRKGVKVLVIGNPANTNALVLASNMKNLELDGIRSMMRLDENRGISLLADKASVSVDEVTCFAVYGNHSPTMVLDYDNVLISGNPAKDVIGDLKWLQGEFMTTVQKRGAAIIQARGSSSAASAANAAIDSIRDWVFATPKGNWHTAGVISDGNSYGIKDGLYFSFPLRDSKIVTDLKVDPFLEGMIKKTEAELVQERDDVRSFFARS